MATHTHTIFLKRPFVFDSVPSPPSPPVIINARTPHGIFQLGGDPAQPHMAGGRHVMNWTNINTAEGVYDFSTIDQHMADLDSNGKQKGVCLRMLDSVPQWIFEAGAIKYTVPSGGKMGLAWDPVLQPKLLVYIKAVCEHLEDLEVDYIIMGGLGQSVETHMPFPADIGYPATTEEFIQLWISSSELLIDTYAANLAVTPFIVAAGGPFKGDPGSQDALTQVVTRGLIYPNFAIMQWGLNANSNDGFYINNWIKVYDEGRANGFQMTGASDGSVGGDLKGTLEQCFANAHTMGADFIEVYQADCVNPAYASLFDQYNSLLS